VSLAAVGDAIDVENQNGSIDVKASDAKECRRAALRTSFGAIRFVLPANPDYRVEARTSFGRIHSEVPISTTGQEAGSSDTTVSGVLGSGRCPLSLTDSNGSIEILKFR
jgi:hypothetical protein